MANRKSPPTGAPSTKLKKIRNANMLAEKMANPLITYEELASKYKVSKATVGQGLKAALSNGQMAHYEQQILDQLVPKALAVIEWNLDNNMDPQLAIEVLKGGLIMKRPQDAQHFYESEGEESLEAYIKVKRKGGQIEQATQPPTTTNFDPSTIQTIIEAEAVRVRQHELPPPQDPPTEGTLDQQTCLSGGEGVADGSSTVGPTSPPRPTVSINLREDLNNA